LLNKEKKMRDKMIKRLKQLKSEFESGQKVATELELKLANTRETLLRISGAIQVLEEELGNIDDKSSTEVKEKDSNT
jgi:biotin operon repressor